jgi:hypothetical protein
MNNDAIIEAWAEYRNTMRNITIYDSEYAGIEQLAWETLQEKLAKVAELVPA